MQPFSRLQLHLLALERLDLPYDILCLALHMVPSDDIPPRLRQVKCTTLLQIPQLALCGKLWHTNKLQNSSMHLCAFTQGWVDAVRSILQNAKESAAILPSVCLPKMTCACS
jgi:hypothetical protein